MEKLETEFAQIVKEQKDTIYTVCYMFSKDVEETNDLFQEILVNLWKGFSSFRGQSHIKTWVWKVSLNTCISFDRKKTKSRTNDSAEDEYQPLQRQRQRLFANQNAL